MKPARLLSYSALAMLLCCSFYFQYERSEISGEKKTLYLISENGKWGYIDKTGKVVLAPNYYSAQDFSEGLAAVRKNGLYGYIDQDGKFTIAEQYDYAEPFINGRARVYLNGKPYYINRAGQKLFEHGFTSIGNYGEHTYAAAETKEGKVCLIDISGKQLTDPDFKEIGTFHNGVSVVIKYIESKAYRDREPGVIDSLGNQVVKFDVYREISDYADGLSIATLKTKDPKNRQEHTEWNCIDMKGNVVYSVPRSIWHPDYTEPGYSEGLMTVFVYKQNPDSLKKWTSDNDYPGVVNRKGELIFSNQNWKDISRFSHGRAFAMDQMRKWVMIDRTGKRVGNGVYDYVNGTRYGNQSDVFANGKALVMSDYGWIYIDTNGTELSHQPWTRSYSSDVERVGDDVIMSYDGYKIWLADDSSISGRKYISVSSSTLCDELIQVQLDASGDASDWGYVDHSGKVIWSTNDSPPDNRTALNIDYMNRGYFMASSPRDSEMDGVGGWGSYDNMYNPMREFRQSFEKGKFQVILDSTKKTTWFEYSVGYEVDIINDSKTKYLFPAENSRLNMIIQAKDGNGEWRDIEYLPHSWCGNSYHTLYLPPQNYWLLEMPKYEGSTKTVLRAKLGYTESLHQEREQYIYSNEITGSVNPAQFWRKREYFPQGIMDSYNE